MLSSIARLDALVRRQPKAGRTALGWAGEGTRPYAVGGCRGALGRGLNWSTISACDRYHATITRSMIPGPPKASAFGSAPTVAEETDGNSIAIPAMARTPLVAGLARFVIGSTYPDFCHPERSEESAYCVELQIPHFVWDDN